MMPRATALLALALAAALHAAETPPADVAEDRSPTQTGGRAAPDASSGGGGSPAAAAPEPRRALEDQLAQEKARLASMEAQLKEEQARSATRAAVPEPEAKPKPEPKPEAKPDAALIGRPSLAAADALYGLGRYSEARPVYEAAAKAASRDAIDRIWALLQAGNCARRLGQLDAALALFQKVIAEYPEPPWFKEQVTWALRTTQWQKRWHRQTTEAGD